ncbi:MAG: hypothetical protein K0R26_2503 [Bacteroidota bacterium]|jgi:hypothetical protein|nr:hypothetical protein [Bacteroidota bacterium]
MNVLRICCFYFLFFFVKQLFSQTGSSCATAINTGTPNGTSTCYSQSNGTTGSAIGCVGNGYGGSGGVTYLKFCTNSSGSCVGFDVTNGTASGNYEFSIFDAACSYVGGSVACGGVAGTGTEFTTAGLGLAANSCYYLRVWSGTAGSLSVCTKTAVITNDLCGSPQQISSVTQAGSNLCATASPTDPPPSQFGAGSLENNIWYSFTTNTLCVSPCTVVVSITNISCVGGGSGFQIGYWSGSCTGTSTTSLTYLGNTTGSGGAVTTTITGLTPGQKITIGIDGNAGANCTFSIAASNTQLLPVDLLYFYGYQQGKENYLEWSSLSESDIDYYLIEYSNNGIDFKDLGRVKANGNSTSKKVYSLIDSYVETEYTFYRLSYFDFAKKQKIFQIVNINNPSKHLLFSVYPNPGKSELNFSFDDALFVKKKISIFDFKGQLVKEISFDNFEYSGTLNIEELKKGIYTINLINGSGEFQTLKFVKD